MSSPPLVCFLHLVNTGGLALYPSLQWHYAPRAALPGARWWRGAPDRYVSREMFRIRPNFPESVGSSFVEQIAAIDAASVRLVLGHFRFGVHALLGRPAVYFTLLRDPVARVVSYYRWMKRQSPRWLQVCGRELTIEEWLDDPRFSGVIRNDMVRSLAGVGGPEWTPDGAPADDPAWVEVALRNLDVHFRAVGIMERYDASVERLRRAFGWRVVVPSQRRRSPGPPEIPAAVRRKVEGYNALDAALYRQVVERFERAPTGSPCEAWRD
jgi:hypothetical protein